MQDYNSTHFHPITDPYMNKVMDLTFSDSLLDNVGARVLVIATACFFALEAIYNAVMIVGCTVGALGRYTIGQIKWNQVKLADHFDPKQKCNLSNILMHIYKTVECAFFSVWAPVTGFLFSPGVVCPVKHMKIEERIDDQRMADYIKCSEEIIKNKSELISVNFDSKMIEIGNFLSEARPHTYYQKAPIHHRRSCSKEYYVLLKLNNEIYQNRPFYRYRTHSHYVTMYMKRFSLKLDSAAIIDESTLKLGNLNVKTAEENCRVSKMNLGRLRDKYQKDVTNFLNLYSNDKSQQCLEKNCNENKVKIERIEDEIRAIEAFELSTLADIKQKLNLYPCIKKIHESGQILMQEYQKIQKDVLDLDVKAPDSEARIAKIRNDIARLQDCKVFAENLEKASHYPYSPIKTTVINKGLRRYQTIAHADVFFNSIISQKLHSSFSTNPPGGPTLLCTNPPGGPALEPMNPPAFVVYDSKPPASVPRPYEYNNSLQFPATAPEDEANEKVNNFSDNPSATAPSCP